MRKSVPISRNLVISYCVGSPLGKNKAAAQHQDVSHGAELERVIPALKPKIHSVFKALIKSS